MNKSEKLRNLLISGINKAIETGRIDVQSLDKTKGELDLTLFGKSSRLLWESVGFGELRVTIWWGLKQNCISSGTTLPLNKKLSDAVMACCSGWLERKDGAWLQGNKNSGLFDTYCSVEASAELNDAQIVEPVGFKSVGKFYI